MLRFIYDAVKIQESIEAGAYDEKGLTYSKSHKYKYPSKLMLIKFLEPLVKNELKNIDGTIDIWSTGDLKDDTTVIQLELKFKTKDCEHDWNDAHVFPDEKKFEHAVAVCDFCGQVAFDKGHEPKKPIFVEVPED
jgi:hypothetical protein